MWIYEIRNIENGKRYIGQTKKEIPEHRWLGHRWCLRNDVHSNLHLQASWNKYGEDAWQFNVLVEAGTLDELNKSETYYIVEVYDTMNLEKGYNKNSGGDVAYLSEESIERIRQMKSKTWAGVVSPTGKVYDTIENMSEFCREHGLNDDKMRQVSRGIRYSYMGWITTVREQFDDKDKEYRKRLSERQKGAWKERKKNYLNKPGCPKKYDVKLKSPSGKVFGPIENLSEFARKHNVDQRKMLMVINRERKSHKRWTLMS